ncbi:MAG: 2-amino-4-hydroxy-6-hydroxymethyldihydropteridine diphosphokinase [Spirochaetes bacterium]|nr:2-amino-4-hydroxy-6-hydroxymethyldihydropteridine diphosphokinase [Spirochaetota bacterium]
MKGTFLALGSNIGDREKQILRAVSLIKERFGTVEISSLYNTTPVGYADQDDFLNMVVKTDTRDMTPLDLLEYVKKIETYLGRKKSFRWGPREIDIDILYKDGIRIDTEKLTIPHREMFDRNFVLVPLAELTEFLVINKEKVFIRDRITQDAGGSVILYRTREKIVIDGKR